MKNDVNAIPTAGFLHFMREKFRQMIIHNSNVFLRDLQYGVMSFLGSKGSAPGHDEAERITRELAARFVSEGVFTAVDHQSWRVNYPQFALPRVEKPAAPAAAAPQAKPAPATASAK